MSSMQLRLLSDIGSLSISAVLSRVLLFLRDILFAGILGPSAYGVWIQIVVLLSYSLHLPMGFQHAMSREVPYYLGRKDYQRATKIQDIVFVITLATALLAIVLVFAFYHLLGLRPFALSFYAMTIVLAVMFVQQINAFYSILLRAQQQFHVFSIGFVMVALLGLLLGAIFAPFWGAMGIAVAQGIALVLVTGFWLSRTPYRPSFISIDWIEFKRLTLLAIPLFIVGISGLLIVSIDRLAMSFFYDEIQLGYYGLAFIFNQSIFLIVTPIVQSLNPRMMRVHGHYNDPYKLKNYLILLTLGMGSSVALLVGGGYLLIGVVVVLILPRFSPAIEATQILALGSVFSALAIGSNAFLVAINKQGRVLVIQAVVLVFQMFTIGIIVYWKGTISAMASAMATAYLLYAILSLTIAGANLEKSNLRGVIFCLWSTLPVVYIVSCAVLISLWHPPLDWGVPLFGILIRLVLFGIASVPALVFLFRVVRRVMAGTVELI